MKVHLKALGCRLNEAELEQWARQLNALGHRADADALDADLMVLNTCAVTGEAARKSRQQINRLHRDNPQAKFIVTGCHASLSPDQVAETLGVDLVVRNEDKDRLVDLAREHLQLPVMPRAAMDHADDASHALFARGRNRAFVKVQDGCRYRCSYCIVTLARGAESSRPVAEVLDQINDLVAQGVQEIVITGVQVGGYGHDAPDLPDLSGLLATILRETDVPRLRVGSLEPWSIDAGFADLFANPRFMPHLHLPLQSGADNVLRRMSRQTRRAGFIDLIEAMQSSCPSLNITSDIIVGFPGETDADWAQTVELVERLRFGHIHIFAYSDRDGTKAAAMADKIAEPVKRARSRQLHDIAARHKAERLGEQLGQTHAVLFEQRVDTLDDGHQRIFGYTPNYYRVALDAEAAENHANRIVNVDIAKLDSSAEFLLVSQATPYPPRRSPK